MERKTREYESDRIVVEFEPSRCIHAAECVRGLSAVFDADARPWVQPDNASPDAVADVVRRCPSGALRYSRTDDGSNEEAPAENTVRLVPDGPLYLAGDLRLHLPDGEVRTETRVALCRCGDSANKPFCDNTHLENDFKDPGVPIEHRVAANGDGGERTLAVRFAPNGPALLEGPLRVIAANENGAEGGKAALCRCGASSSKPYCDGSHVAAGFVAD